MSKENRGESKKKRLLQYIKENDDGLFSRDLDFSLEMFGRTHLVLYGCRKIVKYTRDEMVFRAKDFDISVSGVNLSCAVYHVQGVEISGDIEEIKFI